MLLTVTSIHLFYLRVKELRRNHGHKGQRIYTVLPAKHNLSSKKNCRDSSGVATQGNNVLNIPNEPSNILDPGVPVLCSTPKKSEEGKDAFASMRQGKRPGHQIRDLQRKCVKGGKKTSGRESWNKYGENKAKDPINDKLNVMGLVLGKATTKDPLLGKNSESRNSEKENQQLTRTVDDEHGCGHREFVKIRSGFCAEEGVLSQRCLQGLHERDKERKQRLKQYHKQLQQCWPLSASSSHLSLSEQTPHSPPSSSRQDFNISAPDLMDTDLNRELSFCMGLNNKLLMPPLGEVLDVKTETWQRGQEDETEVGAGDLSVSKECNLRDEEGLEAGYGNLSKTQEQKSKEGNCSAGKERYGGQRWAWAASSKVAQMDVATKVKKGDANSFGNNCDSIQKEEIDCLSTISSGSISEPLSVLLFQTSHRIDPSSLNEEKQNNFKLQNGKGGRTENKGFSFLTGQAKGPEFADKSDASHSALSCSETKQSNRNATLPEMPHQIKDEAQGNSKPQCKTFPSPTMMTQQSHIGHLNQASQSKLSRCLKTAKSSLGDAHMTPTIHLCTGEDLHHAQ